MIISKLQRSALSGRFFGSWLPPLHHSLSRFSSSLGQSRAEGQGCPSVRSPTGRAETTQRLWEDFFADPALWRDNRSVKIGKVLIIWGAQTNPKCPDFKHRVTREALWINSWSNPPWVKSKLSAMIGGKVQPYVGSTGLERGNHMRLSVNVNNQIGGLETSCTTRAEQLRPGVNRADVETGQHRNNFTKKTEPLAILSKFGQQGILVDSYTYVEVLQDVCKAKDLALAKQVHEHIIQNGTQLNIHVQNNLLKVYISCGSLVCAQELFEEILKKDRFTWTTMIGGYAKYGHGNEALKLYHQMHQAGIEPDSITYMSILGACTSPVALQWGKKLHGNIINAGFESDVRVGTALIKMYAMCGSIEDAGQVFKKMVNRNVISWNSMIGAYAESGYGEKAFELFLQMQQEGLKPDAITYLSILNPGASPGSYSWVREVHNQAHKAGLESDVRVVNALINMYAKSGNIEIAQEVFDRMSVHDVISWNVIIGGLARYGYGMKALQLFEQMKKQGVRPNKATFVSVLAACSHAGLVDEGWHHFRSLSQDYGMVPVIEHYNCMVDILCRAGELEIAHNLIRSMPLDGDAATWGALLAACRNHVNIELAEFAAEECLKLEPNNASVYVLLSNVYAAAGMWDQVSLVWNMVKEKGVLKEQGCSWIEVNKRLHSFVADDRSHPQSEQIYAELKRLTEEIKSAGYVPDTRFVTHNIDEQQKEVVLCTHSEKLAIAYGLISVAPGQKIHIFKNIRICSDCHTATKLISKVVCREIVARDVNRFHHFNNGECSCGDYW